MARGMVHQILPVTRNKSAICPLWEGMKYIVWCMAQSDGAGIMVQRLSDGEEWYISENNQEAESLVDLLPDCTWAAVSVDLACEYAWFMHGPDSGTIH